MVRFDQLLLQYTLLALKTAPKTAVRVCSCVGFQ